MAALFALEAALDILELGLDDALDPDLELGREDFPGPGEAGVDCLEVLFISVSI